MSFAPGALVRARGREWVVLPESKENLLVLRPLGGGDDEVAGIYLPLEGQDVASASFAPPGFDRLGDHASCRLLRDAVRLGFRSSAGPFRSFAQLAVEPRPYQLVPLLMALKQDPVRLLIADDVGIGKTVESGLIAREILDRGEAKRLAVLCPPPLAEQWQAELKQKFHIDAELVLASTASRLERHCAVGQSLFELHKYVVVSTDFIKSDRRRDDFLRACPDLVIVDEAHTCAFDGAAGSGRHQRHHLLKGLAANPDRHLVLVTATPHSGKEAAFRSLLTLLRPEFANLPEDLSGRANEEQRRQLAQHVVQRRRGDLKAYLQTNTPFPVRREAEETYTLTPEYRRVFDDVLAYARETVRDVSDGTHRQRVRWWAALGMLRALASSPAAAAMTLRNRAAVADADSAEMADALGRGTVLDGEGDEEGERIDIAPGAQVAGEADSPERRRLLELAEAAEGLSGAKDAKLKGLRKLLEELVGTHGCNPIIFCRFIPTAEYLAEQLRKAFKDVAVVAVTGALPPDEREARVLELARAPRRILVATDCLSEGINLQEPFDAVVHYDLAWNPTRHEQREGRVDRYGQRKPEVRVVTYFGHDNRIDGIVLRVLLRKHKQIRSALGISVPMPVDSGKVMEAVVQGMLLSDEGAVERQQLSLFRDWDAASEREKRSQTVYAQYGIKVDEVQRELEAVRGAIGDHLDVERFVGNVLRASGATVAAPSPGCLDVDLGRAPRALREIVGEETRLRVTFELPVPAGHVHLPRTHPLVERLASHVFTCALDSKAGDGPAQRAGVVETRAVERRTTLLLVRYRFHLVTKRGAESWPLLAEDCRVLGFRGAPASAEWLTSEEAEALLGAQPSGNVSPERARGFLERVVSADGMAVLRGHLVAQGEERGRVLLEAHRRVRDAARARDVRYSLQPAGEPDVLGVFIYLPAA